MVGDELQHRLFLGRHCLKSERAAKPAMSARSFVVQARCGERQAVRHQLLR